MVISVEDIRRQLTRRVVLIGGVQGVALGALAGRMAYLQFLKSDEYKTLSEENRIKLQLIAPTRGLLLDRTGKPLAENTINYRLFIEREDRKQAIHSLDRLTEILAFPKEMKEKLRKEITHSGRRVPLLAMENLQWDEVVKIEFHSVYLPGVYIEEGQVRHYPMVEKGGHLIGYVGRVAESEVEDDGGLHRLPEFKIGKSGIELRFERELRGEAGSRQVEVNVVGISVRELSRKEPVSGQELNLTIDRDVQAFAADALGVESGAIVVMDAHYGELLACVSMPAYDPNQFSLGISSKYWKELLSMERNPLLNKALQGIYPPGSTFKMVVGLAGLQAGVIDANRHFYCPGHYYLGNKRFNCWKPQGHGAVNLVNALAESCDTFFYNVGALTGIEKIAAMCYKLGLGATSGLGLNGEKSGLVPSDEWKRRVQRIPWVKGDTINASIGQGFMLTTPMQLAIMTARMVTGKQVLPTLLVKEQAPEFEPLDIHKGHLHLALEGMDRVCNATNGTAYGKRITESGMEMGGKTGTAQVRRILQRGQDQASLPWKHRHHALFVGYAPVANPRFVASVVVEHGGGGSAVAAPIARDVLHYVQKLAKDDPYRYKG